MVYAGGALLAAVLTPHSGLRAGADLQEAAEAWAQQHLTPSLSLVPQVQVTYQASPSQARQLVRTTINDLCLFASGSLF